eukprot:jgi/Mesvir1/23303/Mv20999-RA.1
MQKRSSLDPVNDMPSREGIAKIRRFRATPAEVEACRIAFNRFDKDGSGSVDIWELRGLMHALGQDLSGDELVQLLRLVDGNGSGVLEFPEFLTLMARHESRLLDDTTHEKETLEAFIAMGGNPDKTGEVDGRKISRAAQDFQLSINVEQILRELDTDGSGYIDYDEFRSLFIDDEVDDL